MKKLNLGSGRRKLPGFINIDVQERCNPDLVADITKGLPYEDSTIDAVRAHDFLEHLTPPECITVMNEIWRVLKNDGGLEVMVPDAEHGQGAFMDPMHRSFWTEGSFMYYSSRMHRDLYGIKADFDIAMVKRILTDVNLRIYHLHVLAKAVK